jgi:argininosuccinate lyase
MIVNKIDKGKHSLIESAHRYELKAAKNLFEGLGIADMAHVAMLTKRHIIPQDVGKALLKKLLAFQEKPLSEFSFDPCCGDVYTNRMHHLKEAVGELTHYIPTGRARREATNIALMIIVRDRYALLGSTLIRLCRTLLNLAQEHKKTYMTDFTYFQHAHPTTLGHYLLSYTYPLLRDVKRCKDMYTKINQSTAGSGSVNGSQLPLDRMYLKELLECDGVVVHTRDAMWQHDVMIESALPLITLLTTISRFAEDLIIWSTSEFGFIELSRAHIRRSVIMPQKKNPYSLAFIRGLARNMIGRFVGIITTGHTASGQPDNRIFIYSDLPECIDETQRAVTLFSYIMEHCEFNKEHLLHSAREGFTMATDIADFLVLHCHVNNRTAYNIVTKVIEKINEKDVHITPELVIESAQELGHELPQIDKIKFYENLSIDTLIERRKGIGGAGSVSMDKMIGDCRQELITMNDFFSRKNPMEFRKRFYERLQATGELL